jgi:hypothetical protein
MKHSQSVKYLQNLLPALRFRAQMRFGATLFVVFALSSALGQAGGQPVDAPRVWNDRDLADWST